MEKLRWSAESSSQGAVPERFLMRLAAASPTLVSLPVIDLSRGRDEVRHAVLHAGKEIGFFQFKRLIILLVPFCRCSHIRTYSQPYEGTHARIPYFYEHFRDTESTQHLKVDEVATDMKITREKRAYNEGDGDGVRRLLPPPDNGQGNTVLGGHRADQPALLQHHVQVLYNGDWVDVEPIPGALGISFGHQLEIATNGALRSVERRTVANAVVGRTSVAATIMPTMDCVVGPAKELVGEGRPARYRSVAFRDFMHVYKTLGACKESVEEALKISPYQASSWYMGMDTTNE
ncbi:unnamed protein product [Triticum turgidum subsp. durum]|uniref:Isopenicillin N synthase-like Fe(2+) 2OG dioxygenase domain-containing protein n=1 Tax=Triticum turgidum subsp. durum TaxID=4567 RepID=A0A9R1AVL2_TRITD|nr:unnamed protein product [Triticum turgidum subsp. durum]